MRASQRFANRAQAGEELANRLAREAIPEPRIVLALPRGGLPAGLAVARRLACPLDILTVRKIGLPGNAECAVGAVAFGGHVYRDPLASEVLGGIGVDFAALAEHAQQELRQRESRYRGRLAPLDVRGRSAIVVDDGLATGDTMMAAVKAARAAGAARVIVAAPIASREAVARLRPVADLLVVLSMPPELSSVGEWYEDFEQVGDTQTQTLLDAAAHQVRSATPPAPTWRSAS